MLCLANAALRGLAGGLVGRRSGSVADGFCVGHTPHGPRLLTAKAYFQKEGSPDYVHPAPGFVAALICVS